MTNIRHWIKKKKKLYKPLLNKYIVIKKDKKRLTLIEPKRTSISIYKQFNQLSKCTPKEQEHFWDALENLNKNIHVKSNMYTMWYQSQKLLKNNKTQILNYVVKRKPGYWLPNNIQAETDTPRKIFTAEDPEYFRNGKKNWFLAKRKRFVRIKKLNKNFSFFSDFWRRYKALCQTNDFLVIRERYYQYKNYTYKSRIPSWAYKPIFPYHTAGWFWKKKIFKLPRLLYKKNPWLNPIYHTRQLYRFLRQRDCHRDKLPHQVRRVLYYNKLFWLMHPRFRAPRGWKSLMIYKIIRRYIILPFLGKWTAKQLEVLIKKIKRTHNVLSGHNFQANFENRLDILAYKMNFAPTIFWSRVFIALGLIWVSKCDNKESMRLSNVFLRDNSVPTSLEKNRNIGFIKDTCKIKSKFLINLKNKWISRNQNITNLDSVNQEELINQELHLDPSYILKKDEIIQISPYLETLLSKNFMNRLRQKRVSLHIYDNDEKTAGLLLPFRRPCILNEDRLKPQYWNPTYLNKSR